MDFIQKLDKKISDMTAENEERFQLSNKMVEEQNELAQSIRVMQEEYIYVKSIVEGLMLAKSIFEKKTSDG